MIKIINLRQLIGLGASSSCSRSLGQLAGKVGPLALAQKPIVSVRQRAEGGAAN